MYFTVIIILHFKIYLITFIYTVVKTLNVFCKSYKNSHLTKSLKMHIILGVDFFPFSFKPTLMLSIHFHFTLPFILSLSSITIYLNIIFPPSVLITYLLGFNLLLWAFLDISHFCCPYNYLISYFIRFVIPHIHLNNVISNVSNFLFCAFFSAHASAPNTTASLTTVLYTSYWLSIVISSINYL